MASVLVLASGVALGLVIGLLFGRAARAGLRADYRAAIVQRDQTMERLRVCWQARSDEAANRIAVQCGVQRADGAPCTLEREHLGQKHSYAGAEFERIFDGFACPLCGRK